MLRQQSFVGKLPMISRELIIKKIVNALQPHLHILALWEGGAAAFNRIDEWSDIDVQIVVRDGTEEQTFGIIEEAIDSLSPIDIQYTMPQPAWHGMLQKFYRLRDTSPFLFLDIAIMPESLPNKLIEPEIHGNTKVHFDKSGVFASIPAINRDTFAQKLWKRVEDLRVLFPLFQALTLKEAHRKNSIEALAFYQSFTLAPLVEVLRMQYAPFHYNFRARYIHYELPIEVVTILERLYFVTSLDDLITKRQHAEEWFTHTIGKLSYEHLCKSLYGA